MLYYIYTCTATWYVHNKYWFIVCCSLPAGFMNISGIRAAIMFPTELLSAGSCVHQYSIFNIENMVEYMDLYLLRRARC